MKRISNIILITISIGLFFSGSYDKEKPEVGNDKEWTIVSFPDFFNFDVPEPWPRWDTAVNWFLEQVEKESPEFILMAGDMVNGHWTDSPKCIEHMGTTYFGNWIRRVSSHGLKYYTAVGDHELGDDPWPPEKVALVPHFENIYNEMMKMPQNGPDNKKGLAYWVRHKNVLIVTVETFEVINNEVRVTVCCEQLEWLKQTLAANKDADFIIVQGHAPVIGKPKARSSSSLMVADSSASELWKVMKEANVDLYLCGEFHAVTINEMDGIWQVVHGSSWGRTIVDTQDYLVIEVAGKKLNLKMKSFRMEAGGEHMWNLHKDRGPMEIVRIPEEVKKEGPQITGTLTIDKSGRKKQFNNITGYFLNQ
ncbi:MAG: metallophosphoesterase [Bacteroidales bacterium]|nr:metallophosphoesterase [Bacteroidales bacterium]